MKGTGSALPDWVRGLLHHGKEEGRDERLGIDI